MVIKSDAQQARACARLQADRVEQNRDGTERCHHRKQAVAVVGVAQQLLPKAQTGSNTEADG